jgi:hypothetical protein
LEDEVRRLGRDLQRLREQLRSPGFVETLITAVDYAVRTANLRKVRRFAAILADGLVLDDQSERRWEEATQFIRDVSELGEADIEVLKVLHSVQGNLSSSYFAPVQRDATGKRSQLSPDPHPFIERLQQVLNRIDQLEVPRDEFYSRCARLSGFGLVLEVPREPQFQSPGDYCYRITLRGKRLVEVLHRQDTRRVTELTYLAGTEI